MRAWHRLRHRHNLVQDFYVPCLSQAVTYDRAVGFFSSTSLALVAQGLTCFIQSQGRMRLVASPRLSEADIAAIAQGLKQLGGNGIPNTVARRSGVGDAASNWQGVYANVQFAEVRV